MLRIGLLAMIGLFVCVVVIVFATVGMLLDCMIHASHLLSFVFGVVIEHSTTHSNLFAYGAGNLVAIYDIKQAQVQATLRGHDNFVSAVKWLDWWDLVMVMLLLDFVFLWSTVLIWFVHLICNLSGYSFREIVSAASDQKIVVWKYDPSNFQVRFNALVDCLSCILDSVQWRFPNLFWLVLANSCPSRPFSCYFLPWFTLHSLCPTITAIRAITAIITIFFTINQINHSSKHHPIQSHQTFTLQHCQISSCINSTCNSPSFVPLTLIFNHPCFFKSPLKCSSISNLQPCCHGECICRWNSSFLDSWDTRCKISEQISRLEVMYPCFECC